MARKALTTRSIEALKPDPDRRVEHPDPALPGLYLQLQTSGAKSWAVRYRMAGKSKKLTLGKWPAMGLADARAAAAEALEEVAQGRDPALKKKATKAARLEAQLTERDKVRTLVEQFDRRHLSTLKSGAEARRLLYRHVVPVWGNRDVHEITRRDVVELLDGLMDTGRGVTANRTLAVVRKLFAWAVERDVLQVAPTAGLKPPAKEVPRDRVLSDAELRLFWRACEAVGQPWGLLGQVLVLTAQRLREVAEMTYDELDGDLWHLPPARTKNARPHSVPLSRPALEILDRMDRIGDTSLIFTTNGARPVSGFSKARDRIHRKMEEIAAEESGERVDLQPWRFHDLRRTAATGMARLGVPVRVTESVLNHVSGTGGGIVGIYQRHDFSDEKRQALEAWARFVSGLAEGHSDNVVPLERGKAL
ncbi:tyrosine-type recombinase/integrase [Tranquillimonas alkanivorans]|uniref:Site-specific recombinase XerD n=1 Tax=Tranquillimonas alkanivorans TaxID=441119 RepID=A0A1I5PPG4_9RHOB|nr:site-specific integrase [Tranquillimonas alkanivorans]SFP35436.1 Site-specific recombinase XerD [Tranquillimonas alkanivorans]